MPLPKSNDYTTEYIYNLPEGERAELIDGIIYDMAPPARLHQKIIHQLSYRIEDYIKSKNGSCEVYPAPFAVFLNKDNKTYVEPDISVICDKDKLDDRGCNGAPDWIVEIVSPSSIRMDNAVKLFKYRSSGVREYWIVDPAKSSIKIYTFDLEGEEGFEEYTFDDAVKSHIYEDLCIKISDLI